MNNTDKGKEAKPGVIAYRTVPGDRVVEHSLNDPSGSVGHFREGTRLYPTQPTGRSLRKSSWKGSSGNETTGETVTYDIITKLPYPVLWFATEGATKANLGAPSVANIKEDDLQCALKEPNKWEMLCPKCKKRVQIKTFLDTGKWDAIDFTELFCPNAR